MTRDEYRGGGSARIACKRGIELPQSKLTEDQVRMIRRQHARKVALVARLNELYSAKGLAKLLGVHHRTVEKVLQRNGWVHVRGDK